MNTKHRSHAIMTIAGSILTGSISAQQQTTPTIGLHEKTPRVHAFAGASVVVEPGTTIEDGTVIVRDGIIEAVGDALEIPPDARVWELEGRTVYAGFIDAMTEVGLPGEMMSPSAGRGGRAGAPQAGASGQPADDGARLLERARAAGK